LPDAIMKVRPLTGENLLLSGLEALRLPDFEDGAELCQAIIDEDSEGLEPLFLSRIVGGEPRQAATQSSGGLDSLPIVRNITGVFRDDVTPLGRLGIGRAGQELLEAFKDLMRVFCPAHIVGESRDTPIRDCRHCRKTDE